MPVNLYIKGRVTLKPGSEPAFNTLADTVAPDDHHLFELDNENRVLDIHIDEDVNGHHYNQSWEALEKFVIEHVEGGAAAFQAAESEREYILVGKDDASKARAEKVYANEQALYWQNIIDNIKSDVHSITVLIRRPAQTAYAELGKVSNMLRLQVVPDNANACYVRFWRSTSADEEAINKIVSPGASRELAAVCVVRNELSQIESNETIKELIAALPEAGVVRWNVEMDK